VHLLQIVQIIKLEEKMQSQSLVTDNRKDLKDEVKELTQVSLEDKRKNLE